MLPKDYNNKAKVDHIQRNTNKKAQPTQNQQEYDNIIVSLSLQQSKFQRESLPLHRQKEYHINDFLDNSNEDMITVTFADMVTAPNVSPNWMNAGSAHKINVIKKNNVLYYAPDWEQFIEEKENENEADLLRTAIPPSPYNTFTRGDTCFPALIAQHPESLKSSQYPFPHKANRKKRRNKKQKDARNKQPITKADVVADQIKNIKRTGADIKYEIKNGEIWDSRTEKIDLKKEAANLKDFEELWQLENVCEISNVCISSNSLNVYSPTYRFQNLISGKNPDYQKAIQILYKNTNTDHPIHRLVIPHLIPSTVYINDKRILHLDPIIGSSTESILMDLDWDIPFPRFEYNDIEIVYIKKKLIWRPTNMCLLNIPLNILNNNSLQRIIKNKIKANIQSTFILYTIKSAMENDYDMTQIDYTPLLIALIRPHQIKLERLKKAQSELIEERSNPSPMNEDTNNNAESLSDDSINSDLWFAELTNEINSQYVNILKLIEKYAVKSEDVIITNIIKNRRWCRNTLFQMSNETGCELEPPLWIKEDSWKRMIDFVVADDCIQSIGKPFKSNLMYDENFVFVTPVTVTGINPKLIVGDDTLNIPSMKFRCGAICKYVLLLRTNMYSEFVATAPTCVCGKKFVTHSACPEQARYIKKRINAIKQRCKKGKITQKQAEIEINKIMSLKCIKCGHWGHVINGCKCDEPSCVCCHKSRHIRTLNIFICSDSFNLVKLFENLHNIIMNWSDINLLNIDHYKLIHCRVTRSLEISELYKVIDSNNQTILNAESQNEESKPESFCAAAHQNNNKRNKQSDISQQNANPNPANNNNSATMRTDVLLPADPSETQLLNLGLVDEDFDSAPPQTLEFDEKKTIILQPNKKSSDTPTKPTKSSTPIIANPYIDKELLASIKKDQNQEFANNFAHLSTNNPPINTNKIPPLKDLSYSFDEDQEMQANDNNIQRHRKPQPYPILHTVQITPKMPKYVKHRNKNAETFGVNMQSNKLQQSANQKKTANVLPFKNNRPIRKAKATKRRSSKVPIKRNKK